MTNHELPEVAVMVLFVVVVLYVSYTGPARFKENFRAHPEAQK